jgi:thiol-disulfide isomerase/thioredoxin
LQKTGVKWLAGAVLACASFSTALAADFDLVDTQGAHHRLADSRGHWVVINFWATWCVPCLEEIPAIADFHHANPRVVVIGIATDAEDAAKVKRFAAKTGHDYPLVLSDDRIERELGAPHALPTTRIYSPDGKLVYDKPGRVDRKLLEEKTGSASSVHRALSAFNTRDGYAAWPSEPL